MLTLNCLGSGSSGNCYILSDEKGRSIILDCGIKDSDVKKAINFDFSNVGGVFVTHGHIDHSKYVNCFDKMGLDVIKPHTASKTRINAKLGVYNIQTFPLPHGEIESYGALIRHEETKETVLYMTDFEYCKYIFTGCKVNHFLVECNYQKEFVDLGAANKEHKLKGHCSLDTCRDFIKANATPYMKSVLLIHLGKGSTNPQECVSEIESVVAPNVSVDYARPNTVYELKGKGF